MWDLADVRREYDRLDAMLGIDTKKVGLQFSKRMKKQYGVCEFRNNRPVEIRLAEFLRTEDEVFWNTARHEYAHAAVALLTHRRHGHDEAWKALCRKIGCSDQRLAQSCEAARKLREQAAEKPRTWYVVTCKACGAVSRYQRRGKVVQAVEKGRHGIVCRRCGGTRFVLTTERTGNDDT